MLVNFWCGNLGGGGGGGESIYFEIWGVRPPWPPLVPPPMNFVAEIKHIELSKLSVWGPKQKKTTTTEAV